MTTQRWADGLGLRYEFWSMALLSVDRRFQLDRGLYLLRKRNIPTPSADKNMRIYLEMVQ